MPFPIRMPFADSESVVLFKEVIFARSKYMATDIVVRSRNKIDPGAEERINESESHFAKALFGA
jgi:hypothetical protein